MRDRITMWTLNRKKLYFSWRPNTLILTYNCVFNPKQSVPRGIRKATLLTTNSSSIGEFTPGPPKHSSINPLGIHAWLSHPASEQREEYDPVFEQRKTSQSWE